MNNESTSNKSWLNRNRFWFISSALLVIIIVIISIYKINNSKTVSDFATAYSDNTLYENALEKVKSNNKAMQILGKIEPIDKLSIFEGTANYSNNYQSVETTIRINGKNANAKMDISAIKKGTQWEYKKITLRIKKSQVTIDILE